MSLEQKIAEAIREEVARQVKAEYKKGQCACACHCLPDTAEHLLAEYVSSKGAWPKGCYPQWWQRVQRWYASRN